jgi:hypothetical protein
MEFTLAGISIGALGIMSVATGGLIVWTVYDFWRCIRRDP